ncbi:unnamed protein product [Musa hybrid cultivar]
MPAPLLARKGRHLQRYENQLRLVAGCIPYKIIGKPDNQSGDLINGVEVLMISSPGRHDFVFPKGGWETDETVCEAACREALEEAGVRGIIDEIELGNWVFRSKSSQGTCSQEGGCRGHIFALEVTEELDNWPEQKMHGRKWVALEEAYALCRYDWMREALDLFRIYLFSKPKQSQAAARQQQQRRRWRWHEVPRRAAPAVGPVRGGDTRPGDEGAPLAGHIRHGGGGGRGVRPRRTYLSRRPSAHQLRVPRPPSGLLAHSLPLPRPPAPALLLPPVPAAASAGLRTPRGHDGIQYAASTLPPSPPPVPAVASPRESVSAPAAGEEDLSSVWCDAEEFSVQGTTASHGIFFEEGYVHSPLFGPMPAVDDAAADGFQLGGSSSSSYYY